MMMEYLKKTLSPLLKRILFREQTYAYFAVFVALLLGGATYAFLSSAFIFDGDSDFLFILLAIDSLVLAVLVFFVGRHLMRLVIERRRRLAGHQLHRRLVTLFGVITVLPAIIVVTFSYFVLDNSLRSWFSERISTAVNASVTVANSYFDEHVQSVEGQILAMANDVNRDAGALSGNRALFDAFLTTQSGARALSEALVLDSNGRVVARSNLAYAITFGSLGDDFYEMMRQGDVAITTTEETNRIRAGVRLNQFVDAYLLVGRFIDPKVVDAVRETQIAATEYQIFDVQQLDLKVSFAVLFVMVALLLLFSAMWVGLNFANAIVLPLGAIIQVAEQVRSGDLKSRVAALPQQDEIAQLGHSFNNMLDEVNKNREELVAANRQLDERRQFTELVLAGVSSGVIGIDKNQTITLPNRTALSMLRVDLAQVYGRKLVDIAPEFEELLADMGANMGNRRNREKNITIHRDGHTRNLLARVTAESVGKHIVGYVVTFDDVTDLLDAQRKAAWADIARRIAHEIKNPLTPIQLAAERLAAKYQPEDAKAKESFTNYIDTIIRQVDDIGRLVNAFSDFARMPQPVMAQCSLTEIVTSQVLLMQAGHGNITFNVTYDEIKPLMLVCDAGLLRQAITNLLRNSIDALVESGTIAPMIMINLDEDDENIYLTIADNGPGLPGANLADLTQPYVTHREKGTGLGLAIVAKVVEDHDGILHLGNGEPDDLLTGAKISLIFPKEDKST